MDVAQLHHLARTLREIALQAAAQDNDNRLTPSQLLVIEDVAQHPKTTAQQIIQRTGLVQSQVSTIVANFKRHNIFNVTASSNDGRKSLITITPRVRKTIFQTRGQQSITKAVQALQPELTSGQLQHLEKLLTEAASLLRSSY